MAHHAVASTVSHASATRRIGTLFQAVVLTTTCWAALAPQAGCAAAEPLHACSYDGSPLAIKEKDLHFGTPGTGKKVVRNIMQYTGLPQNFVVVPGQVPNAAAMVVLDKSGLPKRVIAYNPAFMEKVKLSTQNNNWAPVSIMAHEIGHHLSGHTIMKGGSQPPIELEADKFSGFVLQKMGARLEDAKKAIETIVPPGASKTHPGRAVRIAAISEGWNQSCTQQGGTCDAGPAATVPTAAIPTAERAADTRRVAKTGTENTAAMRTAPTGAASTTGTAVSLPAPAADAVPAKFDSFIMDAAGILDPESAAAFAQTLYQHAEDTGVEIVMLTPTSLHGKTADDYAYAMMRQLRVGKLEVGNGAVLVIAPNENEVGVALGAGVYGEFYTQAELLKRRLARYLKQYRATLERQGDSGKFKKAWAENAFGAADHLMRDTRHWEWFVRYQNIDALQEAANAYAATRRETGARYDPMQDPTWRTLTRMQATLVSRNPDIGDKKLMINTARAKRLQPMHFQSEDGKDIILYFNDHVEATMPVALQEGKQYSVVGREVSSSARDNNYQFDAVSYMQHGF